MLVKEKAKLSSADPKAALPLTGLIKLDTPSYEDSYEEMMVLKFSI
jgi:hypothetical protein